VSAIRVANRASIIISNSISSLNGALLEYDFSLISCKIFFAVFTFYKVGIIGNTVFKLSYTFALNRSLKISGFSILTYTPPALE